MKKKQTLGTFISKNIIYIAFVIMLIGLSVFTSSFLQMKNLVNVLRQATVVGVLSMGMTFVIIGGGIDLSVGSTMALASCIAAAYSTSTTAIPLPLAIALGCLVGIVVGALNGIVVAYLGVVPFIATLGMQYAVRGVALVYTGGRPINALTTAFTNLGKGYAGPIPVPVIIFAIVALISWFFLAKTQFGRYIYAIGGNEKAALVSGLRVKQLKFLSYVINGMTAALAGILLAKPPGSMRQGAVGSPTAGESYDLLAITAVVVGGTSNAGGTGGILPSIIGVFIVTVMNNGMDLLGISGYYQKIVTGVVVLLAVIIDRNNVNRNH
mgnify:CR=1 FL=1